MGLMDMVGGMMGGGGQGGGNPMLSAVIGMIQQHPGGIQGLLGQFQQNGLGEQVQSWVGTGQNQEIGAEHVQQALGQEPIAGLAQQLGIGHGEAASSLAQLLPMVIDKLSPQGQLPSQEEQQQGGGLMGMLGGLLG
ncbi:MAG: YidB family protein [Holophagaceae bacterium]